MEFNCGIKYYLDSFHVSPTYGGLIVGVPDEEMNQGIIGSLEKRASNELFGKNRPYHLIQPETKFIMDPAKPTSSNENAPRLPRWECITWLYSSWEPPEGIWTGSHLFVGWFTDKLYDHPLNEVVHEVVKDLDWKNLAKGYAD